MADEAPARLGPEGPWPPLQEILRRDDVVKTSCPGSNDVLFRRRDDVDVKMKSSYIYIGRTRTYKTSDWTIKYFCVN